MPKTFRFVTSGLSVGLAASGLFACSKPHPPLLSAESISRLAVLPGPDPMLAPALGSSDTLILVGEALRLKTQKAMQVSVRMFWPPGITSGPGHLFPGYAAPKMTCPPKDDDGTVCVFALPPMSSPVGPDRAAVFQPIGAALAIDPGGPVGDLPQDPRPLPDPGPVTTRQDIKGSVAVDHLGILDVTCRADLSAGRLWERHLCRVEYGPYLFYISHDAAVPGAQPFNDPSEDPQVMVGIRDTGRLLVSMLSSEPSLQRALPPVRPEINGDDMLSAATNPASGDTVSQLFQGAAQMMNASSARSNKLMELIARNGPKIAWHDARSQSDFDILCRKAVELKRPITILTLSPGTLAAPLLYADVSLPMAARSLMVVVQSTIDGRPDPWAAAFMKTIGVDPAAPGALTITDVPKIKGDACVAGKLYQSDIGKPSKS